MEMSAEVAGATPLPESGWELHIGRVSKDRPALEVHTGDGLIDVAVAGGPGAALVRGAEQGRGISVARGKLTPGGDVREERRAGGTARRGTAVTGAGAVWAAEVPGRFRQVGVTTDADHGEYRLH